jgi:hypothetical protein
MSVGLTERSFKHSATKPHTRERRSTEPGSPIMVHCLNNDDLTVQLVVVITLLMAKIRNPIIRKRVQKIGQHVAMLLWHSTERTQESLLSEGRRQVGEI